MRKVLAVLLIVGLLSISCFADSECSHGGQLDNINAYKTLDQNVKYGLSD